MFQVLAVSRVEKQLVAGVFPFTASGYDLQRGVSKMMIMGESQLEGVGFGLYLGEPVSKGDFLSEYAGEVCYPSYQFYLESRR